MGVEVVMENLKSFAVVLFVEVSFSRSFEGMRGFNVTVVRRERILLLLSTVRKRELIIIIIIMYIYHALIDALSAHMIHVNLNMIFYTHVEHSPTKTIYIEYYKIIF